MLPTRLFPALALALAALPARAQVTVTLGTDAVAPKMRLGIGVNGGGDQVHLVGANLVDDPSFEGPDSKGFATNGWPWFTGGSVTPAVDTTTHVTGKQSQRLTVSMAPASIAQGRADLPQAPVVLKALIGVTYRVRAQVKADRAGAKLRLGLLNENWQGRYTGNAIEVGTDWQVVTFDYVPDINHGIRGVSVELDDAATYWIDDLVAWDTTDLDPATGLSARFVSRLKELAPASLRLGGLGLNGYPLESFLRPTWKADYGPPALQPDFSLNTFLALCKEVGAVPFLTVPPAFSDAEHAALGDLTHEVIDSVYADHGNLVDYLGGGTDTVYGARRQADGYERWDQAFPAIYFELGNEVWGTPDGKWDMNIGGSEALLQQMKNYATYCQRRIGEMKGRPGWRANMKVGFGGRNPNIWIGGWPGSYDGTLVPALKGVTDFSTTDLYFGKGDPASDTDAAIHSGLFAAAFARGRDIATMKAAFKKAQGGTDLETTVYEGNAEWKGYEPDLAHPSATYAREVSLAAGVSLVDAFGAANRAGVTLANHFHMTGNAWAAVGYWPDLRPKPAFLAMQLFNRHVVSGDMVDCTVAGDGKFDDALSGEKAVPDLACYAYHKGPFWDVILVNRRLDRPTTVTVQKELAAIEEVSLTGSDPAATNEDAENVTLTTQARPTALVASLDVTVPPFSAVVLRARDTEPGTGGSGGESGSGGTEATGGSGGSGGSVHPENAGTTKPGCGCGSADAFASTALLGALLLLRRRT